MPQIRPYEYKAKGYLLGAVAAATYGMNPLFALPLYKAGMDPDSVLFFRYLFAIPLLGTMLKARGRDFKLHRREIVPLVLLGLLVALSSLSLFLSYNYMDAGIASTLLFVYPIFVALIMAFGFRENSLRRQRCASCWHWPVSGCCSKAAMVRRSISRERFW